PGEKFVLKARAFPTLDDLPGLKFDLSLLLMKAHPVVEVARRTVPLLEPWGYMVTCQNGIVEDDVARAVGKKRVVSAIVGWGGTMHAPGVYEKTSPGSIHVGELDGGLSDRVQELGSVLESVAPVVIHKNIRGALWSKLAINSIITTLGALTGETLGTMLAVKRIREVALVLYSEVVGTAEASGVKLEKIVAHPKLLYLPPDPFPGERWLKDLLARIVARKYGRLRSSMLQSLERGRKSEIDFLNGYVVRKAREVDVAVPVNEALVRMIKQIEAGDREIRMQNMDELAAVIS
ncbi:MAG: 2-dehydropantoate 2-reductase, partial [Deltaproteobacteria bacterium]|nr:2-dehydropantoate 2-reductase [Deltaproteobacteria bacterium]